MTDEVEHGAQQTDEDWASSGRRTVSLSDQVSVDTLGLVVGTVPATPLQFSVGLAPGQYVQLDDVVVTHRELPGHQGVQIAGVVTNVEAVHEGARFASDVFLIEQGALPAEVCEVAEVTVTRVEPELYVPPLPGAQVRRAVGAERESALYFDEMGASKVPVGFGRDGQPVYVNFEFLDGTRGAPCVDLWGVGDCDQDFVCDVPAALDCELRGAGGRSA